MIFIALLIKVVRQKFLHRIRISAVIVVSINSPIGLKMAHIFFICCVVAL